MDGTNCSCGIRKLWETRKSSGKTIDIDFYNLEDPLIFTIPTRHSKSLDQLQLRSTKHFHNSLCNIGGYNGTIHIAHAERPHFHRKQIFNNVASEHNMRRKIIQQHFRYKYRNGLENICSCSVNQNNPKLVKESSTNYEDVKDSTNVDRCLDLSNGVSEKMYKQFNIKKLSNVKHQYQVKSLSQTPSDNLHMFRSKSVQFSPKKDFTDIKKYNSILTRNVYRKSERLTNCSNETIKNPIKKVQSKIHFNEKREIGSTSSSTESLNLVQRKTGLQNKILFSSKEIRRVRSASYIGEESTPLLLSGTESLPNITNIAKLENRLYPEMTYYSSSTSSSTSEQSGWITSKSSSIGMNLGI